MTEYGRKHTDGSRSGGQPVTDDAASETGKKMNDIEQKALALLNKMARELGWDQTKEIYAEGYTRNQALFRAIEQHEAYKQKVNDAVDCYNTALITGTLEDISQAEQDLLSFIIPAPKPDPLVEAWIEATGNTVGMEPLNAALEARGLEIRSKNGD